MKIVFLQNSATQPRCHKRYRTFKELGVESEVYTFDRNLYPVNIPKDIPMTILGPIQSGSYLTRFKYYIKMLSPIIKKHRSDSIFYCYGLDIALVAYLLRAKYVYEESDLIYLLSTNKFIRGLMKRLDIFIQRKSLATVITSTGFVDYLYKKKPNNLFVIPNKLDGFFQNIKRPTLTQIDKNKIRFAFIGLLRSRNTITPFIEEMLKSNNNYEFHFWGDGDSSTKDYIKKLTNEYNNVLYHGPFRNPYDLESIYSQMDINFVCYDHSQINNRIAEPNKLYESMFFCKPIIVSYDTYLAKVVQKKGTGFILNCDSTNDIRIFFKNLTIPSIQKCIDNCKLQDRYNIIDAGTEVKDMFEYIGNKLDKKFL